MLYGQRESCHACEEAIDRDGWYVRESYGIPGERRVWHLICLPFEDVINRHISLSGEEMAQYSLWKIQQLTEDMTMLRQRTEALSAELRRQMKANGATDQEVEDFLAEFRLYDAS